MLKLTDEQRKFAEENLGLAYYTLKQMNLDIDQYIGAAEYGICKAAATWDSKLSTFATYSTTVIRNEIFMQMREERSIPKNVLSIDQSLETGSYKNDNKDYFLQLSAPDLLEPLETTLDVKTAYLKAQQHITDIQKNTLSLYLMGLNQMQIGEKMGFTQSYVSRCIDQALIKIKTAYHYNTEPNGKHIISKLERQERNKNIIRLYNNGHLCKAIASELNVPKYIAYRVIKKYKGESKMNNKEKTDAVENLPNSVGNLPKLINPKVIQEYLGCSYATIYKLMRERDFPSVEIGRKWYILEEKFIAWFYEQSKKKKIKLDK